MIEWEKILEQEPSEEMLRLAKEALARPPVKFTPEMFLDFVMNGGIGDDDMPPDQPTE